MDANDGIALLAVAHVASALFMAAPLYMLVIVNERGRLGAPLGLPHDAYMENIIRRQPIRCYAYLAILIVTGVWMTLAAGASFTNGTLLVKIAATLALLAILSYVHFSLQPQVDRALATLVPGAPPPPETARTLPALRLRRKRLAATCLFLVLTAAVFGVRLLLNFSLALTAIVLLACLALSWRAFRTGVRFGYF